MNNFMYAAQILEPKVLEFIHTEYLPPSNHLHLKVLASTICGSDLKILSGNMKGIAYPLIPGHEWVAKVLDAPKEYKNLIGKRIVPDILCCCNYCSFCNKELPNLCDELQEPGLTLPGGFAEFTSIRPENAYIIPDNLSDTEASLLEPLAVALYALKRVAVTKEDNVLIIGGGGIGQLIGQCARLSNPRNIILIDHHDSRLNLASSLFADITMNGNNQDLDQFFINNPNLRPTKIYEVTGTSKGTSLALQAAQKNAEIAIVGYSGDKYIELKTSEIMVKHLTIKGILSPTNTLPEAINLARDGKVNLKPLITHTFKLEEVNKAFEVAEFYKNQALRVAILN